MPAGDMDRRWRGFRTLAACVREARAHRTAAMETGPDIRAQAGTVAVAAWGPDQVVQIPSLINVAALAIAMQRFEVYEMSGGACGLVHNTDLRTTPGEAPHRLRRPWLVQSARPGELLFGSTCGVGYYELDGAVYIVGVDWPDGARVARWVPRWGERDIDVPEDASQLIDDVDRGAHRDWARAAARFGVVLALLLEAEAVPIQVAVRRPMGHRQGRGDRDRESGEPNIMYVSIPRQQVIWQQSPTYDRQGGGLVGDRVEIQTHVRGHLKRQPCGPDRADRKWVWVESYEARRWAASAIRVRVKRG